MIIVRSVLSFTGTPNNGSLPIGNGQGFTINTLTPGTNITITNGPGTITIDAAGGGGSPAGSTNEIQFNNAGTFAADSDLRWIISDNRLVLGTENTADTNSRMVVIGKGISTGNTFVVHNSTGTNNTFIALDNGNVGIGTNAPTTRLNINGNTISQSVTNSRLRFSYNGTDYNDIAYVEGNGGTTGNNGLLLVGGSADYRVSNLFIRSSGTGVVAGLNVYQNIVQSNVWDNPYRFSAFSVYNTNGNTNYSLLLMNGSNAVNNTNSIAFFHLRNTNTANNRVAEIVSVQTDNTASFNGDLYFRVAASGTITERMRLKSSGSLLLGTTTEVTSSILTLESTTKGFLPPRMTTAERDLIATPAAGLLIYNTTTNKFSGYDGTNWHDFH